MIQLHKWSLWTTTVGISCIYNYNRRENYRDIYRKNIVAPNFYSYNLYGSKSTNYHVYIPSVVTLINSKYSPQNFLNIQHMNIFLKKKYITLGHSVSEYKKGNDKN